MCFWNLHFRKEKKKNLKQKIYIYLTVFPQEGFDSSCEIKSEMVPTMPSLNYTHLQELTRSLAKKKKKRKVVVMIICQDLMVGKLNGSCLSLSLQFFQMEPERTKLCL